MEFGKDKMRSIEYTDMFFKCDINGDISYMEVIAEDDQHYICRGDHGNFIKGTFEKLFKYGAIKRITEEEFTVGRLK
jgi:hypothetical protein